MARPFKVVELDGRDMTRYHFDMSTKEKAIEALRDLPEDASWVEIEEKIQFLAAVEKGRQDLQEGRTISHEDVKNALAG